MKVMHCDPAREAEQNLLLASKDGKFRYQIFLNYAKNLPKEYELVPTGGKGSVCGGCTDKDDNLIIGLRGGGFMSPFPATCLIKLDPDGNYLDNFGQGVIGGAPMCLHFFECTDHGTIVLVQTAENYAIEITADGKKLVRTFGEKNKPCANGRDSVMVHNKVRLHNGIFPTEPFAGISDDDSYAWKLGYEQGELGGPFHNPTDVSFDSKGNYYFSDGYANVAVHKFDRDGNFVKTWGGKGVYDPYTDTPGKFLIPHAICVDARDHVWVCDREKDALHVFDTEGNVLAYCSHNMGQPSCVDTDGEYLYIVGRGGYLTIFDLDFNIVAQLGCFNGNLRAHGIAADSKGNLYLFPTRANPEHQVIALKRVR